VGESGLQVTLGAHGSGRTATRSPEHSSRKCALPTRSSRTVLNARSTILVPTDSQRWRALVWALVHVAFDKSSPRPGLPRPAPNAFSTRHPQFSEQVERVRSPKCTACRARTFRVVDADFSHRTRRELCNRELRLAGAHDNPDCSGYAQLLVNELHYVHQGLTPT
jgi:hypothetical protein